MPTTIQTTTAFEKEVMEGLTTSPKHLSSKYFYDDIGDTIFQKIMAMPEYYLTDCEYEILDTYKERFREIFSEPEGFDLMELGAGDGKKTKLLLKEFDLNNTDFTYFPIDISQHVLDELEATVHQELPNVHIQTKQGTYFEVLEAIARFNSRKKVILFLGSNIGNLLHPQAVDFLQKINQAMNPEDLLFIGFDQKKNPQTVLDAYNDQTGITAAFNKNILHRINKELGGNFDVDQFLHWEVYDPETGTAKSYLVSKITQEVNIAALDLTIFFNAWETIHTEISQKYDDEVVSWLAKEAGLQITDQFADSRNFYKNYIFQKS